MACERSRVTYIDGVHEVDPKSLVSHPTSLEVYQDQDEEAVSNDIELMDALRKHSGNLSPVLVLAKDRKTILSGDRRRTGCKILGLNVRIQLVDPGDGIGDIDDFIIDSNQGCRVLTNVQKGRIVLRYREIFRQRNAAKVQSQPTPSNCAADPDHVVHVDVEAATIAGSASVDVVHVDVEAATIVDEAHVNAEKDVDEAISEKMGIPVSTVKAVAAVTEVIDNLQVQGKTDEAEALKKRLDESAFNSSRSLPGKKNYEKGASAAAKQLERAIRSVIKGELEKLKRVASADDALRTSVVDGFESLFKQVQKLVQAESKKPVKKPVKKGTSNVADSSPVPADTGNNSVATGSTVAATDEAAK